MNVNRVYLANIYIVTNQRVVGNSRNFFDNQILSHIEYYKRALVYRDDYGHYIDLETKDSYYTSHRIGICDVGSLVVKLEDGLVPFNNIVQFNKNNVFKGRILKKYNEVKGKI